MSDEERHQEEERIRKNALKKIKLIEDNNGELPSDYDSDDSIMAEWENIHNKVVFDCFNEVSYHDFQVLDGYRPYGLKGPPLPWSNAQRTLTYKYCEEERIDEIFGEA